MDLKRLGETLRNRRKQRGLMAKAVAEQAGISYQYLWILERAENPDTGEPSRPSLVILERLAAVLQLDLRVLAEMAGYKLPDREPEPLKQDKYRPSAEVLGGPAVLGHYFFDENISPEVLRKIAVSTQREQVAEIQEKLSSSPALQSVIEILVDPRLTDDLRKQMEETIVSFVTWLKSRELLKGYDDE